MEEDRFGQHLACLQCGRSLSSEQQIALGVPTTGESYLRREQALKKA